MLHAPRGVVKRHGLDFRKAVKEIAALIQRHGMGKYAAQLLEFNARSRDYIVSDPQAKLALDENLARQHEYPLKCTMEEA